MLFKSYPHYYRTKGCVSVRWLEPTEYFSNGGQANGPHQNQTPIAYTLVKVKKNQDLFQRHSQMPIYMVFF